MELAISTLDHRDIYKLMSGCIIPRPIAWVSTQDANGCNNLAPFSYYTGIASHPPTLCISVAHHSKRETGHKDTLQNILETREFVVNVVTEATAHAMQTTADDHPADIDEFDIAKVAASPSITVRPPRVAESPACFECKLYDTVQIGEGAGSSVLVIGEVTHIFVRDDVRNERGHIDPIALQPLGRSAGYSYCTVRDVFDM